MAGSLEIRSNFPWPSCALSNFAKHPFIMDGYEFGGMEGFLQGCKVQNHEHQKRIFKLAGLSAMEAGRAFSSRTTKGTLFYNGHPFSRFSPYWKKLYSAAYKQCALQNEGFRRALIATGSKELRHTLPASYNEEKTILTEREFIEILTHIRSLL